MEQGKKWDDQIVSSERLRQEMNEERRRQGLGEIPAINPLHGGSANTLARRDKSWKNVFDFFAQLKKKRS